MRPVSRFLKFLIRTSLRFFVVVDVDNILYWRPVVVGDDRFRLDDILDTAGIGGHPDPGDSDSRVAGRRSAYDRSLLLVVLVGEAALCEYVGHVKPSLGVRPRSACLPVRSPGRRGLGPPQSSSGQPSPSPHFERLVEPASLETEPLAED